MNINRQRNLGDLEINFDSLSEYLRTTYPDRELFFEVAPTAP
jgi:hypothetical protein